MIKRVPYKLIISGNFLEYYAYESPPFRNFEQRKKSNKSKIPIIDKAKRSEDSLRRARTELRRLINSNSDLTKFITLTHRENITNLDTAHRHFKIFIQRLRRYYKKFNFKYIAIIEFQKRGSIHYHILLNINYIPQEILASLWSYGFIKIKLVNNIKNMGAYFSKYLFKDFRDPRLAGRKTFFCSKNIIKPKERICQNDREVSILLTLYGVKDENKPDYENVWDTEYYGKILYRQYHLNNKPCNISKSELY